MNSSQRVVIVGGSAGSIEAIIQVLKTLDTNFTLPMIIVIHRLKNTKSYLHDVLSQKTMRKVIEIEDKMPIELGGVYLSPNNYHLLIESSRKFSLSSSELVNYSRPSIDVAFESAASVFRKHTIGVLLSGANEDGSRGMRMIEQVGGITLVQSPESSEIPTMPQSAINRLKNVNLIDTPPNIGAYLSQI